jgi:hypothetical protein
MVRDPVWWFTITAVGWLWAIASCWSPYEFLPFVGLAALATGQALLLRTQVKALFRVVLSFVANSLALGLFLLGLVQLLVRVSRVQTCVRMFALSLSAGLISSVPQVWAMYKARQRIVPCILAYSLPWPAAFATFLILSWLIGPMPERASWFLGGFVGIAHGVASAKVLADPEWAKDTWG